MNEFAVKLLKWYDANKRILPWRGTHNPYRIWLSEIMLQQTRVEAAKGYYERFLGVFPSVQALADAPLDEVLKLWEGLGYYSRARNLHKAARIISYELDGVFPASAQALLALPGVGLYTANAIASIAYNERVPALDGNQARVLARVLAWEEALHTPFDLMDAAMERLPEERPGDYNQALMDLSATICLPKSPRCALCPIQETCTAHLNGEETAYPVKKPPLAKRNEQKTVLIIVSPDGIAIEKRPEKGLLGGLTQFPNLEGHLTPNEVVAWINERDPSCGVSRIAPLKDARHVFTHIVWEMKGYAITLSQRSPAWLFTKTLNLTLALALGLAQA